MQTIYGGTFDNENAAVEAAIKTRHKAKLGKIEAVDDFAFTVGAEETDAMVSKQVICPIGVGCRGSNSPHQLAFHTQVLGQLSNAR